MTSTQPSSAPTGGASGRGLLSEGGGSRPVRARASKSYVDESSDVDDGASGSDDEVEDLYGELARVKPGSRPAQVERSHDVSP